MRKRLKGLRAVGVVGGLASALLLTTQGTAHAYELTWRTDPIDRGKAVWETSNGDFEVHDLKADGRRVVAQVWDITSGRYRSGFAEDKNGANNGPGLTVDIGSLTPGRDIEIEVCTRVGTDPTTDAHCVKVPLYT
ncbi:hypothetical protein ACWEFL_28900 [Streptomyces sp. NPDC004838]